MSKLNNEWKFKRNVFNGDYNDEPVKLAMIEAAMDILGYPVRINEDHDGKGIDLVAIHDPTIGIEVERSKCIGNHWEDEHYSKLSKLEFRTVNMPVRKEKYWIPSYRIGWGNNKIIIDNTNSMHKNIFIRFNWDFSQAKVIYPHIIHNPEKLHRSNFKPQNGKGKEDFLSFKKEDTSTFNRQKNKQYILDTEVGGKFVPLTEEQILQQIEEVIEYNLIIEQKKRKRAVEVYKNKIKKQHNIS